LSNVDQVAVLADPVTGWPPDVAVDVVAADPAAPVLHPSRDSAQQFPLVLLVDRHEDRGRDAGVTDGAGGVPVLRQYLDGVLVDPMTFPGQLTTATEDGKDG